VSRKKKNKNSHQQLSNKIENGWNSRIPALKLGGTFFDEQHT
jgi:hypothetical protein